MDKRTDEELLAEHRAGNSGAFAVLTARYSNELFGFLLRFVNNTAAADDLVQETFLQVHTAAGSFDTGRAFKPWIYTIAANKARDHLRSRSRRQEHSLDSGGNDDGPSPADLLESLDDDLPQQQDVADTRAAVRELIAKMPDHLRLILVLGYYQQLPYAEISEILGIPVGTVKSRLHAAVTHFARLWQARLKSRVGTPP